MFVPMSTSTGIDQHCGSPFFELNQYGVMGMDQLDFFVGVDWSSTDHQVCVVDMKGKVCAHRSFKHCGMGLTEMVDWIVRTTQSAPHKVGVAIETPRGPVVESLMGREFVVYSINPKQLDRYRDRFSLAGAKDDRLDAQMPEAVMLRDCSRLHGQLTADKLRLTNQMRDILWRYYPQFLEIYSDLSRLWVLELWMLAPTPHKAKRLRLSSIERLLKKHRIRCIDAKTVKQCLTVPSVAVAAATTQGAVFQLKSVIERLTVVIRQLKETQREMDRLIDEYDKSFREQDDPEAIQRQRDVEILSSIPGVGRIVLATLLAEASDVLLLRDYNALRALCGAAPVTKRSGKLYLVVRRHAVNPRLQQAIHHWARTAVQHDPVSKAKYTALRARGHRHTRALRSVADRLLKVTCTMLKNQQLFDHNYLKHELAA